MKKLQRLELLKDFVQEAVDRGATSIESIHQYVADLPFEALEATGLLDRDKSPLRAKQQRTIGMVYGAIRRINAEIGQLISDQFENVEETAEVDELLTKKAARPPAAKPTTAQKAIATKAVVKKAAAKKPAAKNAATKPPAAKKAQARKKS